MTSTDSILVFLDLVYLLIKVKYAWMPTLRPTATKHVPIFSSIEPAKLRPLGATLFLNDNSSEPCS